MRLEYFEMIDRVEEVDLDAGTIRASSRVPPGGSILDSHFPKHPILPGVLMLESMNQTAGYMLYLRFRRERFVFLGSVRRARFRRIVKPGAAIETRAKIVNEGPGFYVAETRLTSEGELAADAEIVLIVQEFPSPEMRDALIAQTSIVTFADGVRPL